MASRVTINPDLERERANATFEGSELTNFFHGSQQIVDRTRYLDKLVYSDPEFTRSTVSDLSRNDAFTEFIRRNVRVLQICKEHNIVELREKAYLAARYLSDGESGFAMHSVAFLPMLRLQSSAEQLKKWEPLINSFQMIGCYAQTELGHGSFVRGIETTSVYDPQTREFVLNTPSISSTKWWVGGLGKTANHAIVMAQLHTQGVSHGLHAFLLPLRDQNYVPLAGITVGDIGPKLGILGMDNGFLRLNNVKIPRENMLMRYSKVLEDGTYVKPENDRIIYGGMLGIRAGLPTSAALHLAVAVTIATRYSSVRRQSELKPGQTEAQVIDYQTQQNKLFPAMAMCYAFATSGNTMMDMFAEIMLEIEQGDYKRLIEAHALSSGLKAVVTAQGSEAIEMCRLACGGHGFLEASGLSKLYTGSVAAVTAEGEATVLLLQTARYLMKNCAAVLMNKRVDILTSYLSDRNVIESKRFSGSIDLNSLLLAYAFRANRAVYRAADKIRAAITEQGMQQEVAMNKFSILLVKAARAHVDYVVLRLFVERLNQAELSGAARRALTTLCTLHGIHGLTQNAGDYLVEGYLTSTDVDTLTERLFSLYDVIRVDAVAYVDAFQVDNSANLSVLGRYDGNVYESLIKSAEASVLNKNKVNPSYVKFIRPHVLEQRSKL